MSSCGRVKKRDSPGRLLAVRGGDGDVASIIDILLSKDALLVMRTVAPPVT